MRDQEESAQGELKKYLSVIKPKDKVSDEKYEERLEICRSCEKLVQATCEACGCYVEYRAVVKHSSCPYKKW